MSGGDEWDLETKGQEQEFEDGASVWTVAFSPDGKRVVSGGSDGIVRVWDLKTKKQEQKFEHGDEVFSVAFSPDNKKVVSSGRDKTVRVWKLGLPATFKRKKQDGSIEASVLDPLKVQLLMLRLVHAIKKKEADVLDKFYQQEKDYYELLNEEFDGSIALKLLALKKQKNKKKMKTRKK